MLSWGRVQGGTCVRQILGGTQAPPPTPPKGGEPLIKANLPRTKSNLKKKSRKKKNALTQDRTGRFTAILDFVMNGRSETICVGKTPLPLFFYFKFFLFIF